VVEWSKLTRVAIRTTDKGPWEMDVFWGFHENGSSAATAFFPGGATGEQALITARSMAIRECQVSFIDQRGVRHCLRG